MILDYFTSRKQWEEFSKRFKNNNIPAGVIADEDIWPMFVSAFTRLAGTPFIIITSTTERAVQLQKEIGCILPEKSISIFTGIGSSIFYKNKRVDYDSLAERLNTVKNLMDFPKRTHKKDSDPILIIATTSSLINLVPRDRINNLRFLEIKKSNEYNREELIGWFAGNGYERVNQVYDRGEFSVKGDIVTFFDVTQKDPFRIDFFMDEVEKIVTYSLLDYKDIETHQDVSILPNINTWQKDCGGQCLFFESGKHNRSKFLP